MRNPSPEQLSAIANRLRILSIQSTTVAGSGHPTSCCSAADLVAALFFSQMGFDPKKPQDPDNDRFILSKGHAAPLLYAAWAETGHFPPEQMMSLRKVDSLFEGHPTPRLDFVDLATGSLGQGLSAGVGLAIQALMDGRHSVTYVLMGDGEMAEGSLWEAINVAAIRRLTQLVAIVDVNRLGQNGETAFGHHMDVYNRRFQAFGWDTLMIDGHDMNQILEAYSKVGQNQRPLAILAKTIKGKGIPEIEDREDWHGKALSQEQARRAIESLSPHSKSAVGSLIPRAPSRAVLSKKAAIAEECPSEPTYRSDEKAAPRKAFGNALSRLGCQAANLVVIDGDVGNSTYTNEFRKKYPDRFVEGYIAEQNMVGMATGLAVRGKVPFVATFAAFLSRAIDQVRMAAISRANIKLVGTHSGVSIGDDGPSQMGLEDIAQFRSLQGTTVFAPSDAMSTERLTELMAKEDGIFYMRATRADCPILYSADEKFVIGGGKTLKQNAQDQVTVVATGICVFEALRAHEELRREGVGITVIDAYSIKPLAHDLILEAARTTGDRVITVEDHAIDGGLGDAVAGKLSREGIRVEKLGVQEIPRSGTKDELLALYGIDKTAIVKKVREWIAGSRKSAA